MTSSVSVVIYGVNEAENFAPVVLEAEEHLKKVTGHYQFILIDDGSTDNTLNILNDLKNKIPNRVKVITHPQRQGIGSCLKDGYTAADCDLVTFLPADGQIDPFDLQRLVNAIRDVDFVTTYYETTDFPFIRRLMSAVVRMIVFAFFGPFPRIAGSYMFRREMLESITLDSDSFAINFEFVIKAYRKKFKFKELTTQSRARISGQSKVANFRTIRTVFCEILKMRMRFSKSASSKC